MTPRAADVLWRVLVEPECQRRRELLGELLSDDAERAVLVELAAVARGEAVEPRSAADWLSESPERLRAAVADRALARDDATCRSLWLLCDGLERLGRLADGFPRELEAAKLEAMKELAYGAGHEINNPLANISTRAQTLLREERDPRRRRMLATINRQAFRAHEMIADLMLFARPPQPRFESVDVVALVDRVVAELADEAASRLIELVRTDAGDVPRIEADPTQIAAALRAIGLNALEAIGTGGRVTIVLRSAPLRASAGADGDAVEIVVSDDGPGMDPRTLEHLFDPFFSGREAGRGLGLGLSKCWRIVTLHGGRVTVQSHPGRGAAVTLSLPCRHAPEGHSADGTVE